MQCTCVRQTDLPNSSKLFTDLVYHFDRVQDLYPWQPNNLQALAAAARFNFPDDRRAQVVQALAPLNPNSPSLEKLAERGTVAIVTGQQVGLFSGPAYTVYKALTAIRIASELSELGIPAVPMFWLATEDHDFAEVDHTDVFGADHRPVRLRTSAPAANGPRPVGTIPIGEAPLSELKKALEGLPFAQEAAALVERAYRPGQTMGSAFAALIRELFEPFGLLLIDPMSTELRRIAAPLMKEVVERMPELADGVIERSKELVERGYHAQVLVDGKTSLAFLLENGHRIALRRSPEGFAADRRKWSVSQLAELAAELSPNALLRPVMQDYLFPTAAYVGGPAELAYLAQSQVLYEKLLGRQPVAFPRAGFTLIDERSARRMAKYCLTPADLLVREQVFNQRLAGRLVPVQLKAGLEQTKKAVSAALDSFSDDLSHFDASLVSALATSRRKIEYQVAKITRKTAAQILAKDEQARRDAASLNGLVYPGGHLQERIYSIIPFIAQFGPGLIGEIYDQVRVECPDHQFAVV
ncbi:MAG: bacillithiol synthase [Bryobacterales bacterium]|jgi:bacillithiol biosynthesis cysteine-adding enzyme BshC|nr:bacillithiol synthase [Bryobacterales bacterium]